MRRWNLALRLVAAEPLLRHQMGAAVAASLRDAPTALTIVPRLRFAQRSGYSHYGRGAGVRRGRGVGLGLGVGVGLAGAAAKPVNWAIPVLNSSVLAPVTGSIE